nr:MAG TPA: hypothetical protein [Caudoviricetes sp.]
MQPESPSNIENTSTADRTRLRITPPPRVSHNRNDQEENQRSHRRNRQCG